jgi:D-3-phosphoglycerate dehydrogenase
MPRLSTVTVGSIGFGRAGAALAARCAGFGMRFLAHDPYIAPELAEQAGVELTTKERLLAESDFVHLYVPMKEDTQRIIGAAELAQMKPTAWLVNSSSRASVIDEDALHDALASGRLAGAALDNLAIDPDDRERHNPLLDLPNVILTPHVSHVSSQSYAAMQERVCADVVGFFSGTWPALVANPAVKDKVAPG